MDPFEENIFFQEIDKLAAPVGRTEHDGPAELREIVVFEVVSDHDTPHGMCDKMDLRARFEAALFDCSMQDFVGQIADGILG